MTEQLSVTIIRDSLSSRWGFKLVGGIDCNKSLQVERVTPCSASEGAVRPGDLILAINGNDVSRSPHFDAIDLISQCGGSLNLIILRKSEKPQHSSRHAQGRPQIHSRADDEVPIPVNRNLAGTMQASLDARDFSGTFPRAATASGMGRYGRAFHGVHSPDRDEKPDRDITLYLPKRPSSRGYRFSPEGSGRSSPASLIEMRSPSSHGPPAMAVWTPPADKPHSRLVHLQYNSPLDMYTAGNVADMVERTTGQPLHWSNPPRQPYSDIKQSPTYRYVEELEGRRERTREQAPQSSVIKHLNRNLDNVRL